MSDVLSVLFVTSVCISARFQRVQHATFLTRLHVYNEFDIRQEYHIYYNYMLVCSLIFQ